jgi:hypothetical protein
MASTVPIRRAKTRTSTPSMSIVDFHCPVQSRFGRLVSAYGRFWRYAVVGGKCNRFHKSLTTTNSISEARKPPEWPNDPARQRTRPVASCSPPVWPGLDQPRVSRALKTQGPESGNSALDACGCLWQAIREGNTTQFPLLEACRAASALRQPGHACPARTNTGMSRERSAEDRRCT